MIKPPINQDETPPDKEALDAALIERATQIIRGVARGNGIAARQIKPVKIEGEVFNFEGLAYFKIEAKTSEKRVPGKENGQIVGTAAEMRAKIQNEIEKATQNPDVRRHTIQILKKRADLGVLVHNQYISFDRLRQVFVVHEGCGTCGRDGKMTCLSCSGKGRLACRHCHGTKEMVCTLCRGTKIMTGPQGSRQNCTRCMARGRMGCTYCRQAGTEICPSCKGSGSSSCQNCNGQGWHSLVGTLEVKAKSRFDFDRDALCAAPHGTQDLPQRLEKMGPRSVTAKHMQAAIIEDEERWRQLEAISKPDEYIVPYHLRLPAGMIEFALGPKKKVKAKLFGFVPLLEDMPPFLEAPLMPAFKSLAQAAAGRGAALREAMRARFVAETVLLTLRHNQKKSLKLLQARYPCGVSPGRMQQTIQEADRVMKAIITGPRRTGMIIGLFLAGLLYGGIYISPVYEAVRDLISARGLPALINYAADMTVFLAGLAVAIAVAQQLTRRGVKKALGKYAAQLSYRQLAPSALTPLLVGALFTMLLYSGVMETAHRMPGAVPDWYQSMREQIVAAAGGQEKTAAQGTE